MILTFLPIVTIEVILRMVFPDKVTHTTINKTEDSAYQFNNDYLISLKPDIKKTFVRSKTNGGDIIQWKTNDDSFRGPALRDKPLRRIIIYGDSNIQAEFSKYENTFAYKIGAYLEENNINDVEVVNAGVIGFGPDQSLIKFEDEADKYKPDLAIFHIFADNDFGDILRDRLLELDPNGNLIKTNFKRTVDECLEINTHYTIQSFLSSLMITKALNKAIRLFYGEDQNNHLKIRERLLTDKTLFILQNVPPNKLQNITDEELRIITDAELQKLTDEEYFVYRDSKPQKFSHCADHYDIDVATDPDKESTKTKVKLMEAVLKEAKNFADSKGIKFLVVIQPSVIDATESNGDVLTYQYLQKYPKYKRTNLDDAVETICKRNGIEYLNLFDIFMSHSPDELFFREDDNHWNDRGQDVAAKATTSYIKNHKLLN